MKDDWKSKIIYWIYLTYCKIKRYFWESNFTKKHLSFGIVNGKLQITSSEHEDFINSVQKKINKINQKNLSDFIKLSLEEGLGGCNFIIFSSEKDNGKFVQFWIAEHKLKFNFWANKSNRLKKYYLSIIGLLSESGFVNNDIEKYSGRMVYKLEKEKDHVSVDANFQKDLESASKFTVAVFKDVYKIGPQKLVVKVE